MTDGDGPRPTADREWVARPKRAVAVRVFVFLTPLVVSFVVARLASAALLHPEGIGGLIFFIAQVAVVGTTAALLSGRAISRALPLAALLDQTIMFPDRAPSRFGLALRAGSVSKLRASLVDSPPSDRQLAAERIVSLVSALGRHDRRTLGHTERVRAYSDLIGQELRLSDVERQRLSWAAMTHDVGKLAVPADILNLPDQPDESQWRALRQHPSAGEALVRPLASWLGEWRLAAAQHHERWDGTGYPRGLAGNDISLAGRIVAVADAYDVITSARSYKRPLAPEFARQELVRCSGTHFDPQVVRALLKVSVAHPRKRLGAFGWLGEVGWLSSVSRTVETAVTTAATAAVIAVGTISTGPLLIKPSVEHTLGAGSTTIPTSLPFSDDAVPTIDQLERQAVDEMAPQPDDDASTAEGEPTATSQPSTTISTEAGSAPTTSTTTTSTTAATAPTSSTTTSSTTTTTAATTTTAPPKPPNAIPNHATVEQGSHVDIDVLSNDVERTFPIDMTSLRIIVDPNHATSVEIRSNYEIRYVAGENYSGVDRLTYEICDTEGLCDSAIVTIHVTNK